MLLNELDENTKAIITSINAGRELKSRLYSFGLTKGKEFKVKRYSLNKNVVEIEVDRSLVGLRRGESEKIEVEIIS
ncbi:MAG: ferrous iron transport protein A [Sulfurovum sp.]|jgi:Fe2+ transport system protein FeoA|nr:MAG: ferrous iron transport protein A [Sulfurovum sp.]